MVPLSAGDTRDLLEAAVTAISVLGGAMAYSSGFSANRAVIEHATPEGLSHCINEGIAKGFLWGSPLSVLTLIIEIWSR
jgi:hypothetical protein